MRGVILDIDGTLLDSALAHARAWAEALEGIGIELPLSQIRERIGKGGDKLVPELTGADDDTPLGLHVSALKKRLFRSRYLPELAPLPGARDLIARMLRNRLRLVAASSAGGDEIGELLEAATLADLISDRVSKDDVSGPSKPDPDIVAAALARLGLPASEALMLGDTPYDIEAATKVGVPCVALLSGGWRDSDLAGARAVYDDPLDLLRHYGSSPLGAPGGAMGG